MITPCPHPARVKTLVGDRALCSKCARPLLPPPYFCFVCGSQKGDGLRRRYRNLDGKTICNWCRDQQKRGPSGWGDDR